MLTRVPANLQPGGSLRAARTGDLLLCRWGSWSTLGHVVNGGCVMAAAAAVGAGVVPAMPVVARIGVASALTVIGIWEWVSARFADDAGGLLIADRPGNLIVAEGLPICAVHDVVAVRVADLQTSDPGLHSVVCDLSDSSSADLTRQPHDIASAIQLAGALADWLEVPCLDVSGRVPALGPCVPGILFECPAGWAALAEGMGLGKQAAPVPSPLWQLAAALAMGDASSARFAASAARVLARSGLLDWHLVHDLALTPRACATLALAGTTGRGVGLPAARRHRLHALTRRYSDLARVEGPGPLRDRVLQLVAELDHVTLVRPALPVDGATLLRPVEPGLPSSPQSQLLRSASSPASGSAQDGPRDEGASAERVTP